MSGEGVSVMEVGGHRETRGFNEVRVEGGPLKTLTEEHQHKSIGRDCNRVEV